MNETLESLKPLLHAIDEEKIIFPVVPVHIFLTEAELMHRVATEDRDALTGAGLSVEFIDSLPNRIDALRYAEIKWGEVRFELEQSQKEWKDGATRGFELRDEMDHTFRYAFRKNRELIKQLSRIVGGNTQAEMLIDLGELANMGLNNSEELVQINFDVAKLDEALKLSDTLSTLHADSRYDGKVKREEKDLRDRAFTHLKEAVDEIRDCGKFIFWKDTEKRRDYASSYHRKNSSSKSEEETLAE